MKPFYYLVFLIPLFSGCIALKPDHISTIPNTPISIQWRESVGSNVRVAEILLPTANTIDMYDICIDKPYGTNFNGILWWRYSDTLCNNGSQILSIALSERWKSPVSFVFSKRKYTIPKYSYPRKRIEAVSRLSNSEIGVKVSSDGVKPYSVSINGKGKPFSLLRDTDEYLIVKTKTNKNNPLFIDIQFADGERRFSQFFLPHDFAITVDNIDARSCHKLKTDKELFYKPMQKEDVCCFDKDKGEEGAAIPYVLEQQTAESSLPYSLHFCTTPSLYALDTYSPLGEVFTASNLSFLKTTNSFERVALEMKMIENISKIVRPTPLYWMAPLFEIDNRKLSFDEANALFLSALALGAKGIRVHYWDVPGEITKGLKEYIDLQNAVKLWITLRKRYNFSSLLPYTQRQNDGLNVYTAINPKKGIMAVYSRNSISNSKKIELPIPQFFKVESVTDIMTGNSVDFSIGANIKLSCNESYGAFWIKCIYNEENENVR